MRLAIGILTAVGGSCLQAAGILTIISSVLHRRRRRDR